MSDGERLCCENSSGRGTKREKSTAKRSQRWVLAEALTAKDMMGPVEGREFVPERVEWRMRATVISNNCSRAQASHTAYGGYAVA